MDGGLFREARERAGLSLHELALALDVREEYLRALERGELGRLIGPSYAQSIAVRYAAGVSLDPEKALAACDEGSRPPSSPDDRRPSRPRIAGPRLSVRRFVLVALLMIGVVVVVLGVLQAMSVISLTEATSASVGGTVTTVGAPTATSTAATSSTTSTTTTVPSTVTTEAAGFTVVFAPSADVWLEITDQKTGKAIFSGLRAAGERLRLQFTAAAKVVVGKPEVLKVSFNGRVVKTPTALVWRLSSAGITPEQ